MYIFSLDKLPKKGHLIIFYQTVFIAFLIDNNYKKLITITCKMF